MIKQLPLALALAVGAGTAAAETSPWYLGLTQSIGHDSNLQRQPGYDDAASTAYSVSKLIGGLDWRPGRQHLVADVHLSRNRYEAYPSVNQDGYGIAAILEWETVEHVSGQVELKVDKTPGNYEDSSNETGGGRTTREPRSLRALFRLGDYNRSRLWGEADLARHETRRLAEGLPGRTICGIPGVGSLRRAEDNTAAGLGARYRVGGSLVLGIGLTFTRGQDRCELEGGPVFTGNGSVPVRDNYTRRDIDLLANWSSGGGHKLQGRLSFGRLEADQETIRRDRSGPSGLVRWEWEATPKVSTALQLAYESNSRRSPGLPDDLAAEPTTLLEATARYAISAKLSARLDATLKSRQLSDAATGGRSDPTERTDERKSVSAGIDWAALRNVALGCSVGLSTRNASALSDGYTSTQASCTVRAVLQ